MPRGRGESPGFGFCDFGGGVGGDPVGLGEFLKFAGHFGEAAVEVGVAPEGEAAKGEADMFPAHARREPEGFKGFVPAGCLGGAGHRRTHG